MVHKGVWANLRGYTVFVMYSNDIIIFGQQLSLWICCAWRGFGPWIGFYQLERVKQEANLRDSGDLGWVVGKEMENCGSSDSWLVDINGDYMINGDWWWLYNGITLG